MTRVPSRLVSPARIDLAQVEFRGAKHTISRGALLTAVRVPLPALTDGGDGDGGDGGCARSRVLTLASTHLDHMNEAQRVVQVEHLLEELAASSRVAAETRRGGGEGEGGEGEGGGDATIDLVAGDLNALTRADYSDAHWARLLARAAENGWPPPVDSDALEVLHSTSAPVVERSESSSHPTTARSLPNHSAFATARTRLSLERLRAAGYADAFTLARSAAAASSATPPPESAAPPPPLPPLDEHAATAHLGLPLYRIDYVWVGGALQRERAVRRAFVARGETAAGGSDHFPLVVDLALGLPQ